MIGGQADVFIEMEQLDPRPVDIRLADQTVEERELRCPGGRNEASAGPGYARGFSGIGRRMQPTSGRESGAPCTVCRHAHRQTVSALLPLDVGLGSRLASDARSDLLPSTH